ncbi:MAG: hypothetical protein BWK78_00675 [Thiotrichaceae bacterium IS1]|nr:MAG: hypothetical protein BWK78_00675 [Thiotrichaceae bacterium IS1]
MAKQVWRKCSNINCDIHGKRIKVATSCTNCRNCGTPLVDAPGPFKKYLPIFLILTVLGAGGIAMQFCLNEKSNSHELQIIKKAEERIAIAEQKQREAEMTAQNAVNELEFFRKRNIKPKREVSIVGIGSCANFELPTLFTDKTVIDRTEPVRVLRQDAPLYPDATSTTPVKSLDFDTILLPTRQLEQRIEVKEMGVKAPLGWIDKHELLCNFRPLFEKGVARKALIKTPIGAESNFSIKASHSPNEDECSPHRPCGELKSWPRFTVYFIFAEDRETDRYLLSQGYNLTTGTRLPLVGWVKGENMIPWNTNLGIRPKNDSWKEADTEIITGYHTLEDAKQNKAGIKLLSGNIWYTYELHVPVLEKVDGYYHVIAPNTSVSVKECDKPFECRVMDFYIPMDAQKIQEEMMMIEQHIDRWIKLLARISQARGGSVQKKREDFVELLIEEIQGVLGDPPISLTVNDKTALQTILERHKSVLPMREQSPLLQYSVADIWTMEGCELDRLLEWVTSIRNVLEKVLGSPELKISFELKDYTDECLGMTDKGKRLKKMVSYPEGKDRGGKSGPSQLERLGPDSNYRYGHTFRSVTLYWLPVEFLP